MVTIIVLLVPRLTTNVSHKRAVPRRLLLQVVSQIRSALTQKPSNVVVNLPFPFSRRLEITSAQNQKMCRVVVKQISAQIGKTTLVAVTLAHSLQRRMGITSMVVPSLALPFQGRMGMTSA